MLLSLLLRNKLLYFYEYGLNIFYVRYIFIYIYIYIYIYIDASKWHSVWGQWYSRCVS